jgi:hypothetical protein
MHPGQDRLGELDIELGALAVEGLHQDLLEAQSQPGGVTLAGDEHQDTHEPPLGSGCTNTRSC